MFSINAYAEEDKYRICFIQGYFAGEGDKFMNGLATHISQKKGVLTEPMCSTAHQVAYKVAVKFNSTGKYDSAQDYKIIKYATDFREKVNIAISSLIKY